MAQYLQLPAMRRIGKTCLTLGLVAVFSLLSSQCRKAADKSGDQATNTSSGEGIAGGVREDTGGERAHSDRADKSEANKSAADATKPAPGDYNHYILALSWSPSYCADRGDSDPAQCQRDRPFAFVLHGLWPQAEGSYPLNCQTSDAPDDDLVQSMLDIMPSDRLVTHEWQQHGSCTGSSPKDYFALSRKAFQSIRIPADYVNLAKAKSVQGSAVSAAFMASNKGLSADGISVRCRDNRLSEVWICLDADLKPRPCSASVKDYCSTRDLNVPPIRAAKKTTSSNATSTDQ